MYYDQQKSVSTEQAFVGVVPCVFGGPWEKKIHETEAGVAFVSAVWEWC